MAEAAQAESEQVIGQITLINLTRFIHIQMDFWQLFHCLQKDIEIKIEETRQRFKRDYAEGELAR